MSHCKTFFVSNCHGRDIVVLPLLLLEHMRRNRPTSCHSCFADGYNYSSGCFENYNWLIQF
ncbi:hypothetical protein TYRP_018593 [Tyrophagus putrescentiae]|nr:hypothetical protein TYRP_018593 [Tyrophagus putrescentiae]